MKFPLIVFLILLGAIVFLRWRAGKIKSAPVKEAPLKKTETKKGRWGYAAVAAIAAIFVIWAVMASFSAAPTARPAVNLELPVGKPVKIQMTPERWTRWIMPAGKAAKSELWCPAAGCEIIGWDGRYIKLVAGNDYTGRLPNFPFRLRGMGTAEVTFR